MAAKEHPHAHYRCQAAGDGTAGGREPVGNRGGLGNHVHVQLQCAIGNTEHFAGHAERAKESGIVNSPDVADGYLFPSMLPGWGAELDWSYIRDHTVAEYS